MNGLSLHNKHHDRRSFTQLEQDLLFQQTVEEIIREYAGHSFSERNTETLLATIYKHTRNPAFFSTSSSLIALAKFSNYLLQSIGRINHTHLFSIRNSSQVSIPELNIQLSLQLELGEWKQKSFVVKKFVWNEFDKKLLTHLISLFTIKAYSQIPDEIELIDLSNGEVTISPISEYHEAILYVKQTLANVGKSSISGSFYRVTTTKKQ
ncbi:hypothetical protein [Bacillus pinisoli]|uniref:hypothetical protein n=1 Tax=Bacillus pinisoli TaxID=2901866 RepID=UPI001FF56102|nr:hypothetical protein [Bacillus pinisoli]